VGVVVGTTLEVVTGSCFGVVVVGTFFEVVVVTGLALEVVVVTGSYFEVVVEKVGCFLVELVVVFLVVVVVVVG
jgi:hypothetical protein